MPNSEMVPQTKPAEMSFSDWKKMKNALHNSVQAAAQTTTSPTRKNPNPNISASSNNNNFNNFNRNFNNSPFFEHLKQNNQRLFGGRFCNGRDPIQRPFFNSPSRPMMGSSYNQHFSNQSNNFDWPNNTFMNGTNNFMMPKGSIVQQPFPMNTYRNQNRMENVFMSKQTTNSRRSSSIVVNKNKSPSIKLESKGTKEETPTTPIASNKSVKSELALHTPNQEKPMLKTKKPKRWNIKPPKPPTIIATTPESKEEKQRMWREYRQKMKPFKNRDFHNAKRVVQRLTKKNLDELDEKDKDRLARAKETVAAYKAKLTEKAAKRRTFASDIPNSNTTIYVNTENGGYSPAVVAAALTAPPPPPPPLVENEVPSSCKIKNDDGSNQTQFIVNSSTHADQWSLWNTFIPGGVVFDSTTK